MAKKTAQELLASAIWVRLDLPSETNQAVGVIFPRPSKQEFAALNDQLSMCNSRAGFGSNNGSWAWVNIKNFMAVDAFAKSGKTISLSDLVTRATWGEPDEHGKHMGSLKNFEDAVACLEAFKWLQIAPLDASIANMEDGSFTIVVNDSKFKHWIKPVLDKPKDVVTTTTAATSYGNLKPARQLLLFGTQEANPVNPQRAK